MGVQVPPFAMIYLLCLALLGATIDPAAKGFDNHSKKHRVESYDFAGTYSNLEEINIDARRQKRVEIDLSGSYPELRSFVFDGTFGVTDASKYPYV